MKSIVILLAVLGLALCEDDPPPEEILKGTATKPDETTAMGASARSFSNFCPRATQIGGCGKRCPRSSIGSRCKERLCTYRIRSGYYCGLLFNFVFPIHHTGPVCANPGAKCSKSSNPWPPSGPWISNSLHPGFPRPPMPVESCYCCTTHKWIKKIGVIYHNGWYYIIKFWIKVPGGCDCYRNPSAWLESV